MQSKINSDNVAPKKERSKYGMGYTYREMVRTLLNSASYEEKIKGMTVTEIARRIAKFRNEALGIAESSDAAYTVKKIYSDVYRAMEKMYPEEIADLTTRRYTLNDEIYIKGHFLQRIKEEVPLGDNGVLVISHNTLAIHIRENIRDEYIVRFEEYLGERNCYRVAKFDGDIIILMIKGEEKEVEDLVEDIVINIKKAQEYQKEHPIMLKIRTKGE